ncbi:MAG: hypothetical protein V1876_04445 [Candidatus Peregrinibacteria bacterium]
MEIKFMTDPQQSAGFPPIPPVKTGAEIFDSIMVEIEPELTTAGSKGLDEKYKGETPEQKKARGERYAKAFEEYEKHYAAYRLEQESQVHAFKRQVIQFAEGKAGDDDQQRLFSLESALGPA